MTCPCALINPGITVLPVSATRSASAGTDTVAAGPAATTRPFRTTIIAVCNGRALASVNERHAGEGAHSSRLSGRRDSAQRQQGPAEDGSQNSHRALSAGTSRQLYEISYSDATTYARGRDIDTCHAAICFTCSDFRPTKSGHPLSNRCFRDRSTDVIARCSADRCCFCRSTAASAVGWARSASRGERRPCATGAENRRAERRCCLAERAEVFGVPAVRATG